MPDPLLGRDDLIVDAVASALNVQALLTRLGIYGPVKHLYEPIVLPVAIVDAGQVTLSATVSPQALGIPASIGEATAPAANTRLANTGPLAAGNWNVQIFISASESNFFRIRRRTAGDGTDVWVVRINFTNSGTPDVCFIKPLRMTLAANEFLVIENVNAGGGGIVYQASIWTQGPF